jgi:hypothetical protein
MLDDRSPSSCWIERLSTRPSGTRDLDDGELAGAVLRHPAEHVAELGPARLQAPPSSAGVSRVTPFASALKTR